MKNTNQKLRTATVEDFKVGTTLITSEGYGFSILRKYDEGVWEARGTEGQGDKCVFDIEARFYRVASCDAPCSPSDFYVGGKCDKNGCV